MYKKSTTTVIEEYDNPPFLTSRNPLKAGTVIHADSPLTMKVLEFVRETAISDEDLHVIVERMLDLSRYGNILEMEDYSAIIKDLPTTVLSNMIVQGD